MKINNEMVLREFHVNWVINMVRNDQQFRYTIAINCEFV